MNDFAAAGVRIPDILLPDSSIDPARWACIACDQYTSQEDYWRKADSWVGESPSTLRLVLPEVYLNQAQERIPRIHQTMRRYLGSVLTRRVHGFVLTARTTQSGCRLGLVLAVDLEQYDYRPGSLPRIRATEGTILERIPPRQKVRAGAPLECPHIMLLADDRGRTLVEPIWEAVRKRMPLYDTDLGLHMGHLTGWEVSDQKLMDGAARALAALDEGRGDAPLLAVGDGNHSLASAKANWEQLKPTLSKEAQESHPARWALCEVVNLYDEALTFEPIHRLLTGVQPDGLADLAARLGSAQTDAPGNVTLVSPGGRAGFSGLPVQRLQPLLDEYLSAHPGASIDYVHGDEAVQSLGRRPGCCALLVETLSKLDLFPAIAQGPLPRKAFSMGEANEKRCYYECRSLLD